MSVEVHPEFEKRRTRLDHFLTGTVKATDHNRISTSKPEASMLQSRRGDMSLVAFWDGEWEDATGNPVAERAVLDGMDEQWGELVRQGPVPVEELKDPVQFERFWRSVATGQWTGGEEAVRVAPRPRTPEQRKRVKEAQRLREKGWTYLRIGLEFRVSEKTARKWCIDPPQGKRERKLPTRVT